MSFARGRAVAGEDSEEEEDEQPQTIASGPRGQLVSGEDSEEEEEEEEEQQIEQPAVPAAKPAPIAVPESTPAAAASAAEQAPSEAAVAEASEDSTSAAAPAAVTAAAVAHRVDLFSVGSPGDGLSRQQPPRCWGWLRMQFLPLPLPPASHARLSQPISRHRQKCERACAAVEQVNCSGLPSS